MSVVIVDHYDSFTENLVRYVKLHGYSCCLVPYDELVFGDINASHIILSPGPKSPRHYPNSLQIISLFKNKLPILGVCLGHQMLGSYFGMQVKRSQLPAHAYAKNISLEDSAIFQGLPKSIKVACYNSLVIEAHNSSEMEVIAKCDLNEIMAIQHEKLPLFGVQFHPESVLTEFGATIIKNFLEC